MRNPFRDDIRDPAVQRRLVLGQDKRLLDEARIVAEKTPKALLVGGFVRDALLGLQSKDADLEVYGISAEDLEQTLERLFSGRVVAVGRAFGVFKVRMEGGLGLDVAIPRRESKSGKGHRGFVVTGDPDMSAEEAARRRDFTVNAIAADPITGEITDPFDGIADLDIGILRVTDPKTFQDDPLRVYRAAQFAARFEFTVEPETFELMSEMVGRGDLEELSKERVTEEIKKLLLLAETPSIGFGLLRDLGVISRDYPELQALIGLEQDAEWHPEGDVWTHTMSVLDSAAAIVRQSSFSEDETLRVMLGALCHDLGKAGTTAPVSGRVRSLGHEEAGVDTARSLCGRWTFPKEAVDAAVAIAKEHLAPMQLWRAKQKGELDEKSYLNAVRRVLKRITPLSWRVYLAAVEADWRGRGTEDASREMFPPGEAFINAAKTVESAGNVAEPLLHGRDLAKLGIKPGPEMGEWIRRVEEARDRGEIETREEASGFVREALRR